MATCSSARRAVPERRGSTTTTRPPRCWMPRRRPRASGAVISDPLEATGLAPRTSSQSQRSRSGTATVVGEPNRYADASCLGYWSTVLAENRLREPSALSITRAYSSEERLCALGLPTYAPTALRSPRSSTRCSPSSTSANASSQPIGSKRSPTRRSGVRMRSGSSCSSLRPTPFGHRKPWEKTSSASPRTRSTAPSRSVTSRPHVASHSGHVRYCVAAVIPRRYAMRPTALRAASRGGSMRPIAREVMPPRSMDPGRWRDTVSPVAEGRIVAALDRLADFPVLDGTVTRVIAIADDPETTTADLVAALEGDPTFAANLLRYANSAMMARPIRAKTVRQAVMLVGRKALRKLALEAATYRFFERAPGTGRARGELHLHAVAVATVAAAAADQVRAHGDAPHLGGLLHDIGRYVLPIAFGEQASDEIAAQATDGAGRVMLERERFGIDHALAGALLAERWGVAPDVVDAIAWHHGGTTGVGCPNPGIGCVQLADEVVHMVAGREPDHVLLEVALERAGLPATALDRLAQHTLPGAAPALDEGSLARRATDTERLSETDALTGTDTRRHWLHATRAALLEPGGATGAIVLCDVDGLDEVNRTHGHRMGDVVLTEVARILGRHGRPGRLGGDLFALWIRAGDVADAAAHIADEVHVAFGDRADAPRVDVSLGLAEAATHGTDLSAILEAALVALATAKDMGRGHTAAAAEPFGERTRYAPAI